MADIMTAALTTTWTNAAASTTYEVFTDVTKADAPVYVLKFKKKGNLVAGDNNIEELKKFTALQGLVIQNTDATNFVTFGYTDAGATGREIIIAAGEWIKLSADFDNSTTPTIVADTTACDVWIQAWGT
jgi:hypothetical protein